MKASACKCKRCGCRKECEYYFDIVKPVMDLIENTMEYDGFIIQIHDALEGFQCDYFEYPKEKSSENDEKIGE